MYEILDLILLNAPLCAHGNQFWCYFRSQPTTFTSYISSTSPDPASTREKPGILTNFPIPVAKLLLLMVYWTLRILKPEFNIGFLEYCWHSNSLNKTICVMNFKILINDNQYNCNQTFQCNFSTHSKTNLIFWRQSDLVKSIKKIEIELLSFSWIMVLTSKMLWRITSFWYIFDRTRASRIEVEKLTFNEVVILTFNLFSN